MPMLLLCDILPAVKRLSSVFQQRELDFSVVVSVLKAPLATTEARQYKNGSSQAGISGYMDKMSAAGMTTNLPKSGN